ncbi:hypothetical protein IC229_33185 [Spirosoma sp. BT702]|uniref:Uncharacterized protein n=1 Tax=Spirosoma profusum TaxID=2771354 RepID=A0A927AW23_9BACT|nr:hypothetical protein [Spirosoma profusum]MBD2705513.1 hypothetical protein [Spirosoma profusum]
MTYTTSTDLDNKLLPTLTALAGELPFLSRLYGRCRVEQVKGVDKLATIDKDKPRRLPLWWNSEGKTNIPVVPDENEPGLLFFITTGVERPEEWQEGQSYLAGSYTTTYPLALLCWYNAEQAQLSQDEVKRKILFALGRNYAWKTTAIEDQLATRVFRELDYDFQNHTYLLYPHVGIRIEGELTITETLCS